MLLSIVIPAYNAAEYLARALDSVVGVSARVEVLVVDDGSTDATAEIAQQYVERGVGRVRLIRQRNGGHGAAVNTGIRHAEGTYLKVVDADDWVDRAALVTVLTALEQMVRDGSPVDLVVTNFVYEKVGRRTPRTVRYVGALPRGRELRWDQTRRFAPHQYLMMHALTYRTSVLRASGLQLPEHTFYVDNLYALVPLGHVETLLYLDVDLYRYFIGRPDQSVQEGVMLSRLDQQLLVNRLMIEHLIDHPVGDQRLDRYRRHYTAIICAVTSTLTIRTGDPAWRERRDELWVQLRAADPRLFRKVRFSAIGQLSNLPGRSGRRLSLLAYRLARRTIGFS